MLKMTGVSKTYRSEVLEIFALRDLSILGRRNSSMDCDMEVATDQWTSATEIRKAS
jgi:hypothetical protein